MTQIFVFTAGNPEARHHLDDSIKSPIAEEKVFSTFQESLHEELRRIQINGNGFYAWGAEPGRQNVARWERMARGDKVFCVYNNTYRFVATVLGKYDNEQFAKQVWGINERTGETWRYIYFLSEPTRVNIPVSNLANHLNRGYMGFTKISDKKLQEIRDNYGSVERFVEKEILGQEDEIREDVNSGQFIAIIRRYREEGTVFQSVTRGARYYIESVDDEGCVVERIDANERERCTVSEFRSKKELLRNSGGRYRFNDFDSTAAKRATYLQALPFAIGADRETILDVSKEEDALKIFCHIVENLRVYRSGEHEEVYKPALLATVIEAVESHELAQNRIVFDWILPRFRRKMTTLGKELSDVQAATAFYHLTGDLFWMLCYNNPNHLFDASTPSPSALRERVKHAIIKDTFWRVLEKPPGRKAVMDTLEKRWWPSCNQENVLQEWFEGILSKYSSAKMTESFGRQNEICGYFESLHRAFETSEVLTRRPRVKTAWSVGRGNWAEVPWISFLDERETDTTQRGVYCVFLFRQDMSGVYLTFNQGVTQPLKEHGRAEGKRILRSRAEDLRQYCDRLQQNSFTLDDKIDLRSDRGLGSDYEDSTVAYKLYEKDRVPSDAEILADLEGILQAYQKYVESRTGGEEARKDLSAIQASFSEALRLSNISFGSRHEEVVRSFIASLATKRFVILTGLSGSGKTQIAIKLGEWLGNDRLFVVPVRPDWTGSEAIFGYEDALLPCSPDGRRAWYVPEVLKFMLKAARDPESPYLLVLDEMNLAHVERYFADVLSGMESMHPCLPNIYLEGQNWRSVPGGKDRLLYPSNLFIVGTVNVDETTYMFSPKVLDRANTLEFRVHTTDLSAEAKKPARCEPGDLSLIRGFRAIAEDEAWHLEQPLTQLDSFLDHLRDLHSLLSGSGFEFGHRAFYETVRFAAMHEAAGDDDPEHALDLQVMQKVLPRLHGSRRRLEPILCALGKFCFDLTFEPVSEGAGVTARFNPLASPQGKPRPPISFDKIRRMTQSLRANQFVSFTE